MTRKPVKVTMMDDSLAHQIRLIYAENAHVQVGCVCGWKGQIRNPSAAGALGEQWAEYRSHDPAAT